MKTFPRLLVALVVLALSGVGLLAAATPAQAVDYYRYWSYFHVEGGAYQASNTGIAAKPADGSVEAFRFAASAESSPNLPRVDPAVATFDAVCGDEDAESGEKRVAVIIDYGVEADAEGQPVPEPEAECADVATDATTAQVLQDVTRIRTKTESFGLLLCAIDGYPARGCADQVTSTPTPADSGFVTVALDGASPTESATESATQSPTDSASADPSDLPQGPAQDTDQDTEQGRGANPTLYFGLGVVLFAILGGGIFLARRRRGE